MAVRLAVVAAVWLAATASAQLPASCPRVVTASGYTSFLYLPCSANQATCPHSLVCTPVTTTQCGVPSSCQCQGANGTLGGCSNTCSGHMSLCLKPAPRACPGSMTVFPSSSSCSTSDTTATVGTTISSVCSSFQLALSGPGSSTRVYGFAVSSGGMCWSASQSHCLTLATNVSATLESAALQTNVSTLGWGCAAEPVQGVPACLTVPGTTLQPTFQTTPSCSTTTPAVTSTAPVPTTTASSRVNHTTALPCVGNVSIYQSSGHCSAGAVDSATSTVLSSTLQRVCDAITIPTSQPGVSMQGFGFAITTGGACWATDFTNCTVLATNLRRMLTAGATHNASGGAVVGPNGWGCAWTSVAAQQQCYTAGSQQHAQWSVRVSGMTMATPSPTQSQPRCAHTDDCGPGRQCVMQLDHGRWVQRCIAYPGYGQACGVSPLLGDLGVCAHGLNCECVSGCDGGFGWHPTNACRHAAVTTPTSTVTMTTTMTTSTQSSTTSTSTFTTTMSVRPPTPAPTSFPTPCGCNEVYEPVCANGWTFASQCFALCAGRPVTQRGACPPTTTTATTPTTTADDIEATPQSRPANNDNSKMIVSEQRLLIVVVLAIGIMFVVLGMLVVRRRGLQQDRARHAAESAARAVVNRNLAENPNFQGAQHYETAFPLSALSAQTLDSGYVDVDGTVVHTYVEQPGEDETTT
eukprot:m.28285 g.28285  ORF g.28285 m.28285 type:complete len:692 (-) comp4505_c0_seq1:170-2245(-)